MGLIVLIAFKPLLEVARAADAMDTVLWAVVGGRLYIVGAVIYATAKREFVHNYFFTSSCCWDWPAISMPLKLDTNVNNCGRRYPLNSL